jgi:hypothetical protein
MNKNLETYRRNIQDGFYNGIDLTIEKKNSILRKSAEIIGNALDAKVSSYGNAYIIETQNTVILLGHGKDGRFVSEKPIDIEENCNVKKDIILGFCGSKNHPYNFVEQTSLITFPEYTLLSIVLLTIQEKLSINNEEILIPLANILQIDSNSLKALWQGWKATSKQDISNIFQNMKKEDFIETPSAVLFHLYDPVIGLDPGGGGGGGLFDPLDLWNGYGITFIKELTQYEYLGYNYEVAFRRPDDIYTYSHSVSDEWFAPGADWNNDIDYIWHHIPVEGMNSYKTGLLIIEILFAIIMGLQALFWTIAGLTGIGLLIVGVYALITVALSTWIFTEANEFITSMEAERNDGWMVFKIQDSETYITTGRVFWDPSIPDNEKWTWIGDVDPIS